MAESKALPPNSAKRKTGNRILLLNCTRFGDLLQTQPLISGLADQGGAVGVCCLENFRGAVDLLQDVSYAAAIPGAKALAALDRHWPQALGQVWEFREQVHREFQPDALLNVTATIQVRLLSRFLSLSSTPPAPERGFCLDAHGFSRTANPWVAFLLASTRRRGCSPFNLVDSFWKAAGLPDTPRKNALKPPTGAALQAIAPLLEIPGAAFAKGFVGLQLGASEERRRWPIQSFAICAARLWREQGLAPVVLGSKGEVHLAERFAAAYGEIDPAAPLAVATGKTTLPELAALLTRCRLLITNDTGTMHLAAGLGVDIASIFLATAQPWDTGPYRPGSLSLEPDIFCHPCAFGSTCPRDHICRQSISGEVLAEKVGAFLLLGRWPKDGYEGARAWESCVDEGEGYYMNLISLSGHETADRTRWIQLQREMYRRFLDDLPLPPPTGRSRQAASPALQEVVGKELREATALFTLLEGQLMALQQAPLPPLKRKFLATWERLQATLEGSQYLNVLGYMLANTGQEMGEDLGAMAVQMARYKALLAAWIWHLEGA